MRWRSVGWLALAGLLAGKAAQAAIFTVGDTGVYSSLQAAVNDALVVPGAHEIRVRAQTVNGSTTVPLLPSAVSLRIRGGWNDTFTQQIAGAFDTGATRLSGAGAGTTFRLTYNQGEVRIEDLRIGDGQGVDAAGGLHSDLDGGAILVVERVSIEGNSANTSVFGGGAHVRLRGQAQFTLRSAFVGFNTLVGNADAVGAGVSVFASDTAQVLIENCVVTNNSASATGGFAMPGVAVEAAGASSVRVSQCDIGDNSVASAQAGGIGVHGIAYGTAQMTLESLYVVNNLAPSATGGLRVQLYAGASDSALAFVSDSLIVRGDYRGMQVQSSGASATARLNNLTVAGHANIGLLVSGAGTRTLYNSIVHGNGGGVSTTLTGSGNNLGADLGLADPRFVNAATGDYRVRSDSPAIDAGNMNPPGGLGLYDVFGASRVQGAAVDIGAYERAPVPDDVFRNGFE